MTDVISDDEAARQINILLGTRQKWKSMKTTGEPWLQTVEHPNATPDLLYKFAFMNIPYISGRVVLHPNCTEDLQLEMITKGDDYARELLALNTDSERILNALFDCGEDLWNAIALNPCIAHDMQRRLYDTGDLYTLRALASQPNLAPDIAATLKNNPDFIIQKVLA